MPYRGDGLVILEVPPRQENIVSLNLEDCTREYIKRNDIYVERYVNESEYYKITDMLWIVNDYPSISYIKYMIDSEDIYISYTCDGYKYSSIHISHEYSNMKIYKMIKEFIVDCKMHDKIIDSTNKGTTCNGR